MAKTLKIIRTKYPWYEETTNENNILPANKSGRNWIRLSAFQNQRLRRCFCNADKRTQFLPDLFAGGNNYCSVTSVCVYVHHLSSIFSSGSACLAGDIGLPGKWNFLVSGLRWLSIIYKPRKSMWKPRGGGSPGIWVSILDPVGPPGTLAPELQASQAGFLPE